VREQPSITAGGARRPIFNLGHEKMDSIAHPASDGRVAQTTCLNKITFTASTFLHAELGRQPLAVHCTALGQHPRPLIEADTRKISA